MMAYSRLTLILIEELFFYKLDHIQMTPSEERFNQDGGLEVLVAGPL